MEINLTEEVVIGLIALLFFRVYYTAGEIVHRPALLRHVMPKSDLETLELLKRVDKLLKIKPEGKRRPINEGLKK
jgi:hypothetical protein